MSHQVRIPSSFSPPLLVLCASYRTCTPHSATSVDSPNVRACPDCSRPPLRERRSLTLHASPPTKRYSAIAHPSSTPARAEPTSIRRGAAPWPFIEASAPPAEVQQITRAQRDCYATLQVGARSVLPLAGRQSGSSRIERKARNGRRSIARQDSLCHHARPV